MGKNEISLADNLINTIDEVETKLVEIGELSTYSGKYTVTKEADYSRHFMDEIKIWGTEKNNLFNPIDFEQYQTLIDEIEAEGLAQAEEKGIYSAAEENVKSIIINFLSGMNEYEVKFI